MKRKKRTPKASAYPLVEKKPKIAHPPMFRGGSLSWRFNAVDKSGPFSWAEIPNSSAFKEIIEKLSAFETMGEHELASSGCHSIPLENLSDAAQKRLSEIELDDLDDLYSFRLTGARRVFGVVRKTYVRVLWYDPHHEVCPSAKKHT